MHRDIQENITFPLHSLEFLLPLTHNNAWLYGLNRNLNFPVLKVYPGVENCYSALLLHGAVTIGIGRAGRHY